MANQERLPPLQSLAFFECAARHGNFTSASQELQTTQPAVSHRISQLEEDLGVSLFLRQHRGVSLTEDGRRLFEAVRDSLDAIRKVTTSLRTRRTRTTLTLATDFGFAGFWLMPRLGGLQQLLPQVDICIVTSQGDFDARQNQADIAIAFGAGQWSGCEALKLFPEQVVPVCSPAFLAAHAPLSSPAELSALPLLHVQGALPERWVCWHDWFHAQHRPAAHTGRDLIFNTYSLVIQAALAGQGVALGWFPLINDMLKSGQLVIALPIPLLTERGYYLVEPQQRQASDALDIFHHWLLAECAQTVDFNS
jgi:putative choline sulfate-utilization transcription factor